MIDPRNMTFEYWAAQLTVDFPHDIIPQITNEEEWQDWAQRLLELPAFSGPYVPRPEGFSSWREWAERLYGILN